MSNGSHITGYYPAVGYDGLRCMVAYDLEHLLTADNNDISVRSQLDTIGIPYQTEDSKNERTKETYFRFNGKDRKITEFIGDAIEVNLQDTFGTNKADVYHLYRPTGFSDSKFTPEKYDIVNPNGFLCLDEHHIGGFCNTFFEIAGLKEHEVVKRHMHTILTGHLPGEENEINGVIYQKAKNAKTEMGVIASELLKFIEYHVSDFDNGIKNGVFEDLGSEISLVEASEPNESIESMEMGSEAWNKSIEAYTLKKKKEAEMLVKNGTKPYVDKYFSELSRNLDLCKSELVKANIQEDLAHRFKEEFMQRMKNELKEQQGKYSEFAKIFRDVTSRVSANTITEEEAFEALGYKKSFLAFNGWENNRFPFANRFVLDADENINGYVRLPISVAEDFTNANF